MKNREFMSVIFTIFYEIRESVFREISVFCKTWTQWYKVCLFRVFMLKLVRTHIHYWYTTAPCFFLLNFFLCTYNLRWMSCLISFAFTQQNCEEREASKNYKIKNSCPQWDSNPYPAQPSAFETTVLSTKPDTNSCEKEFKSVRNIYWT